MSRVIHLLFSAIVAMTLNGLMSRNSIDALRLPPPPVQINKCCRIGQYLDGNKMCITGSSEKWVPPIFMIAKKSIYSPRGEHPRFFTVQENTRPAACNNQQLELYTDNNSIIIFSNGTLYLSEKNIIVSPEDYCADKNSALVCSPKIHGMDPLMDPRKIGKVRKCCHPKSAYNETAKTCSYYNNDPEHPLYESKVINSTEVEIVYGFPVCSMQYSIAGKFQLEFLDTKTGNLTLESKKVFKTTDYCLEYIVGHKSVSHNSDFQLDSASIFICSYHTPVNNLRSILLSVCLFISVIFLFATLLAGFLVPSNHHLLHWRCQIYYFFCLLVGDLLLAISQIMPDSIVGVYCEGIAILMHFFFLAAFFWLNTMCFNIWWTFRDFRPTSLEKNQEVFRLRIYKVYAWGVPLLIVSIGAILDKIPQSSTDNFLRPKFGEPNCWFNGKMEKLTYFFGPIGVLLFVNLLLFASTARQLTCGLWKRDDVKSTTERTALGKVCLKMVIVMGITWVADIVSALADGPAYIWYVPDLINALQGVFIFIVVGCQPQIWSAIKRFFSTKMGREATNTTNGPQHSSSSHGLPSIGDTVTNNTLINVTQTKIPMETVC